MLFPFPGDPLSWQRCGQPLSGAVQVGAAGPAQLSGLLVAVMRTQGSLRLILNTKLWAQMQIDKASEKSIRITAMDTEDQGVKVFLISVSGTQAAPGLSPAQIRREAAMWHWPDGAL